MTKAHVHRAGTPDPKKRTSRILTTTRSSPSTWNAARVVLSRPRDSEPREGRATARTAGTEFNGGQDVRAEVLRAIAAVVPGTDLQNIAPDRPLRAQVDLDSVDWINLVEELCERLSVDIPESDYGRLTTLDAVVAYLRTRPRHDQRPRPAPTAAVEDLPFVCHLIDGRHVTVRPIAASDGDLERAFVERLSMQSRYERFMATMRELPAAKLRYLVNVDQRLHVALIATTDRDGGEAMVGAARYAALDDGVRCEFAVAIDEDWRRSGLAGVLMHALIDVARRRGLKVMEGAVLATNSAMLRFTRQLGFTQERSGDDPQTVRVLRPL